MSNLHINWTRYTASFCGVNICPTCQRPRRMLAQFQDWYGTTWTCAGCGDQWQDGERLERPFEPGWRRRSIEYARRELAKLGIPA